MNKSAKFDKVKGYYDNDLWTEKMVRNAVGRWITEAEADEIINGAAVGDSRHDGQTVCH